MDEYSLGSGMQWGWETVKGDLPLSEEGGI